MVGSYPIKDKTKASLIKDKFEKDIEKLEKKTENYTNMIKTLRNKPIPQALKDKLLDDRFGKEHAFESMKHNHTINNRFTMANCDRCKYNKTEIEAENLIDGLNGNETSLVKNLAGVTVDLPLSSLKIYRGRYDDVIGYVWGWK